MAHPGWTAFPYPDPAFDYAGDRLARAWDALHAGDQEPFPDEARVRAWLVAGREPDHDAAALAARLQDAWRAYHRGDFAGAWADGIALGPLGATVAIRAGGVHAAYLLHDDRARAARYGELARLAAKAAAARPHEANGHYGRAFALARLGRTVSAAKALTHGFAGKTREALDRTLALAPRHAEAHTALGLHHAEIVGRIGALLAKMAYGASAADAERHLDRALELTPKAPAAWIEYANALLLLHGERREDAAAEAYDRAAKLKPRDAAEALAAAWAKEQIE